jgi:predicted O-methyltransferase YrrM
MTSKAQLVREAFGFLYPGELDALRELANGCNRIVNIGAGAGTSGLALREGAGNDAQIWTIDICAGGPTGGLENERNAFDRPGEDWKLPEQILGDSKEIGESWQNGQVDFVFIDGDHSYLGCRGDILAWMKRVRSGGVIALHDYAQSPWGDVVRATDELLGECEVVAYVDTLKAFRTV